MINHNLTHEYSEPMVTAPGPPTASATLEENAQFGPHDADFFSPEHDKSGSCWLTGLGLTVIMVDIPWVIRIKWRWYVDNI